MTHDIQSASLVDQTGVQSCNQVAEQQRECSCSSPRFQISQGDPTEDHTERQHRIDEPELFVRKQTEAEDSKMLVCLLRAKTTNF